MKKKIYTFILFLLAILVVLYFVWTLAANIQGEALKRYLRSEWSLNLDDGSIKSDGFPFKFVLKVSNLQSPLKSTPLTLQFFKLDIVRLIYNFSDVIVFAEKPSITNIDYPEFNSSSKKLKVSISNKPFSGKFRLISELQFWQISNVKKNKIVEAEKVIFALKDADEEKLDFYVKAYNLSFGFLDKIQGNGFQERNEFIIKGKIQNSTIDKNEALNKIIKLETLILEQLDIDIGFLSLSCNEMVPLNLSEMTTEGDIGCLLKLNPRDISRIKTKNETIQKITNLINFILIIKNLKKTSEKQKIPIKFSLNEGLFYLNGIPIYHFPKRN